jgi:hypothetical protein
MGYPFVTEKYRHLWISIPILQAEHQLHQYISDMLLFLNTSSKVNRTTSSSDRAHLLLKAVRTSTVRAADVGPCGHKGRDCYEWPNYTVWRGFSYYWASTTCRTRYAAGQALNDKRACSASVVCRIPKFQRSMLSYHNIITASQPRRPRLETSLQWELQN